MEKPLDQDSLFSLELAVENVCIPDVVCRFPAVAFRLLDFPTLIIYHVEPEVGSTIKCRISQDSSIKLPSQLRELKDRHDNFVIKKGKSCIFKVSPQTLHTHLTSTPLYVMIIDTYPEVPKLVGNCSLPMDVVMDRVHSDIRKFGISMPSVQGERGDYKVYNLMGREIGKITMGFRLLSLGVGLLPHIPDHSVMRVGKSDKASIGPKKIDLTPAARVEEATEVIIKDIQAADKSMQVSLSASFDNRNVQTDTTSVQNAGVQTFTQKKSKKKERQNVMRMRSGHETSPSVGDLFVTNVECPPPLFYNSEFSEPPRSSGLTFYENTRSTDPQKYTMFGDPESPNQMEPTFNFDSDTWSEEGTIRLEDNASVIDEVDFDASRIVRTRKTHSRKMVSTPAHPVQQIQTMSNTANTMMPLTGNLSNFPMLNALLSEIVALQGQGHSGHQPLQQLKAHKKAFEEVAMPQNVPKTPSPTASPPKTPIKGKENREEVLARLATPRNPVPKYKPDDANIGSRRGSLKRQPSTGVQKTKLAYGMTNTQRLRLAKVQPELLKSLEKQEEERVRQIRAELREKGIGLAAFQKAPSMSERGLAEVGSRKPSAEMQTNGVHTSVDEASVYTTSEYKKRPVPTPRLSVHAGHEPQLQQYKNAGVRESRSAPAVHRQQECSRSDESRSASQPSRAKSIDVHMPASESDHHVYESDTSAEESQFDELDRQEMGQTKTLYNPGFPEEANRESIESRAGEYSEDFEGSHQYDSAGEEPELRRVVDYYSDQSEDATEPSLRKVVEKYSDDDDDDDQSGAQIPQLQQYVESYADQSESGSFETASSHASVQSPREPATTSKTYMSAAPLNPRTSAVTPRVASRQFTHPSPHVLAASSATFHTQSSVAATESVESTAYISRSQIPSETGTSVESYTDTRLTRRPAGPRPSPRRTVERMSSVHTESVSSYAPSDAENISPGPLSPVDDEEDYSDAFDSSSEADDNIGPLQHQDVKNMAISERARLGYTWT